MIIPYISYYHGKISTTSRLFKRAEIKNNAFLRGKTVEENRAAKQRLAEVRPIPKNVTIEPREIGGVSCEWSTQADTSPHKVILYLHGGCWAFGNLVTARPMGVILSELTTCTVVVVDYRLSPEHPYPAGLEDCHAVYTALLEQGFAPEKIGIMGDSAGGNLALCLTHLLRIKKRPLPGAIALASPVTDVTFTGPMSRARPDLMYTVYRGVERDIFSLYVGKHERLMPTISPRFGDLSDFPPILIHVGEDEPLCKDNINFARIAHKAGVNIHCRVWAEMFHDFTIVGLTLKESRLSLKEIGAMLEENLA